MLFLLNDNNTLWNISPTNVVAIKPNEIEFLDRKAIQLKQRIEDVTEILDLLLYLDKTYDIIKLDEFEDYLYKLVDKD